MVQSLTDVTKNNCHCINRQSLRTYYDADLYSAIANWSIRTSRAIYYCLFNLCWFDKLFFVWYESTNTYGWGKYVGPKTHKTNAISSGLLFQHRTRRRTGNARRTAIGSNGWYL